MSGGLVSPSTTVLSTPTSHDPPSSIRSIRPERSCKTWRAVVGEGLDEAFADGAARGLSVRWMSASARREDGMRTATVVRLAVTSAAKGEGVGTGSRIVRGPGQNLAMSGWYMAGIGS